MSAGDGLWKGKGEKNPPNQGRHMKQQRENEVMEVNGTLLVVFACVIYVSSRATNHIHEEESEEFEFLCQRPFWTIFFFFNFAKIDQFHHTSHLVHI